MWDQVSTKCKCPIVIRGMLNGRRVSLSTAKFLPPDKSRDLEAARDLAILWERSGSPIRPEEYAQAAPVEPEPTPPRPTVEAAIAAYMADARDRGNGEATVYKKATVFERTVVTNPRERSGAKIPANTTSLLWFCRDKGIRFLSELTLPVLCEWRSTSEFAGPSETPRSCDRLHLVLRAPELVSQELRRRDHNRIGPH